jgi:Zn-finger nucleic acid-binding protein
MGSNESGKQRNCDRVRGLRLDVGEHDDIPRRFGSMPANQRPEDRQQRPNSFG